MNPDYQEYLKSPHWQERRLRVLARGDNECERCRSQVDLAVHHKTYKNIGNEKQNDLIILCEVCHTKFHNEQKYPLRYDGTVLHELLAKYKG